MSATAQELPQTHSEVVAMTLLSELQPALAVALDSLGGRMTKGVEDLYYLYASSHINTAVDAFILLRREHRIDGARLTVRPALETMLRLQAVRTKPYLLYRVLLREALEADKWFGSVARRHGVAYTRVCDRDGWQAFKSRCAAQFGPDKLEDAPLNSYGAAAAIGAEAYYDSHYRGYCQYTHGALEAVSGSLDELTDPEDARVMLHSAISALEALVDMGAECPGIASFRKRFGDVIATKPDRLCRQKQTGSEASLVDEPTY
ncbi:MAG TPA: DUF5677 domain-containing protein [Chthoniobacterales bacterium]|jgi:hypothetical protein